MLLHVAGGEAGRHSKGSNHGASLPSSAVWLVDMKPHVNHTRQAVPKLMLISSNKNTVASGAWTFEDKSIGHLCLKRRGIGSVAETYLPKVDSRDTQNQACSRDPGFGGTLFRGFSGTVQSPMRAPRSIGHAWCQAHHWA